VLNTAAIVKGGSYSRASSLQLFNSDCLLSRGRGLLCSSRAWPS